MLLLISPAKTLDDTPFTRALPCTQPAFTAQSHALVTLLADYSPDALSSLMGISPALAALNAQRFAQFQLPFTADNAKPALFTFMGDVYEGLAAADLSDAAVRWLQDHLRILSGLYGLLRPLDYMQPYRLEMGTRLPTPSGTTLYAFWGDQLTTAVNTLLEAHPQPALINLASNEYVKALQTKKLRPPLVTPVFQDEKNGSYKVISFYAKRARGLMTRFAAEHGIDRPEGLRDFAAEGYRFVPEGSDDHTLLFRRAADAIPSALPQPSEA